MHCRQVHMTRWKNVFSVLIVVEYFYVNIADSCVILTENIVLYDIIIKIF